MTAKHIALNPNQAPQSHVQNTPRGLCDAILEGRWGDFSRSIISQLSGEQRRGTNLLLPPQGGNPRYLRHLRGKENLGHNPCLLRGGELGQEAVLRRVHGAAEQHHRPGILFRRVGALYLGGSVFDCGERYGSLPRHHWVLAAADSANKGGRPPSLEGKSVRQTGDHLPWVTEPSGSVNRRHGSSPHKEWKENDRWAGGSEPTPFTRATNT